MVNLPPLDDPKAVLARVKAKLGVAAPAKAGGDTVGSLVGQMVDAAATMDSGSLSAQMARAYAKKYGLDLIQSPEEVQLAEMETRRRLFDAQKADAMNRKEAILAAITDPKTLEAIGINPKAVDPDTLLQTNPELFGDIGQRLGVYPRGEANSPPAYFMKLAGVPITSTANAQLALQAQETDKANKKLADTAQAVQHEKVNDAAVQEAAAGEGNLGERIKQANPNLPSYSALGLEEVRVARQKFATLMEQLDTPDLRKIVAEAYLTRFKPQILDNFEENPVVDDKGNALVGKGTGTYFVNGEAKGELGAFIAEINQYLPGSENDLAPGGTALRAIGLGDKYAGINRESLAPFHPALKEFTAP